MLRERGRIEPLIAGYWVVALDRNGVQRSSKQIADLVRDREERPPQRTAFVLGGPHGIDERLLAEADLTWSLGKATLPHQLARVVVRRAAVSRVHDPARGAVPPLTRRCAHARGYARSHVRRAHAARRPADLRRGGPRCARGRRGARAPRGSRERRLRDDPRDAAREAVAPAAARDRRGARRSGPGERVGRERRRGRARVRQRARLDRVVRRGGTPGSRARLRRRHREPAAARQRRVRLGQPDRPPARLGRAERRVRRLARAALRVRGPRRHARVLLQRLGRSDRALRPLAARPRARRGGARGRLPERVADRDGEGHGTLARRPGRGVRPRRRGAHVRGHPRDARALPRAHGRVHERGRSARLRRRRARARRAPGRPGTCSSRTGPRGCARASSATTRIARC